MESKKAKLKFIKNWLGEESAENNAEENSGFQSHKINNNFN